MEKALYTFHLLELKRGNFINLDPKELVEDIVKTNTKLFAYRYESKEVDSDLDLLEIIHFRNNLLWINIQQKFEFNSDVKKDLSRSLFFDYVNILTLTQNNLQTLHYLLYKGFDHQATIILRNHLELFELMLSILGDEEQYKFYTELLESQGREFNRSIKFTKTTKVNKKILKSLKDKGGFEIYEGFFDTLSILKQNYHKKFSSTVHPDRTSIIFNANVFVNEGNLAISLGGRRSLNTKQILNDLLSIEVLLFQYIVAVQIDKHKMYFKKYGEDSEKLAFLVGACWNIYFNHESPENSKS